MSLIRAVVGLSYYKAGAMTHALSYSIDMHSQVTRLTVKNDSKKPACEPVEGCLELIRLEFAAGWRAWMLRHTFLVFELVSRIPRQAFVPSLQL